MRVLVAGGRHADRATVMAALDAIHGVTPVEVIIEGGEGGAAFLAASWARLRGVSAWRVPSKPEDGLEAAVRRDLRMMDMCQPDCVLTFPGAEGTAMVAKSKGVPVREPGLPGADPRQVDFLEVAA